MSSGENKRRSIGFVVGTEGLSVSAPRWVSVHEVEQASTWRGKAGWILRKLHEQRERPIGSGPAHRVVRWHGRPSWAKR